MVSNLLQNIATVLCGYIWRNISQCKWRFTVNTSASEAANHIVATCLCNESWPFGSYFLYDNANHIVVLISLTVMNSLHFPIWQTHTDIFVSNWPTGISAIAPYCLQVKKKNLHITVHPKGILGKQTTVFDLWRDSCSNRLLLQLISASIEVQTKPP